MGTRVLIEVMRTTLTVQITLAESRSQAVVRCAHRAVTQVVVAAHLRDSGCGRAVLATVLRGP
jgi:hypothetical protein